MNRCNDAASANMRLRMHVPKIHLRGAPFRALVLTLALLCVQTAFAVDLSRLWPIAGAGAAVKEVRNVGHFRAVRLSTDARVIVRQGKHDSVVVEAESNVLPLVETYVEDGTLVVEDARHFKSPNAAVVITVRRISSIGTTGTVAVTAEGLNVPTLSLSMGGSSALSLKAVSVGKLRAALGGSSALKVSGVADDLSAELGGSSALRATELAARSVSVNGGGSAQAVVWATESLSISLSGSAGVSYFGIATPTLATSGAAMVKYLGTAPPTQQ